MIKKNLAATDCFYILHSHKAYYSTIRTCVIGTAYLLYPKIACIHLVVAVVKQIYNCDAYVTL